MKQRRCLIPIRLFSGLAAAALGFLPSLASAHPGHYHPPGEDDEFDAFATGFLHPLTGMDHLILAIAAGWLAFSWKGGKARIPITAFLVSMATSMFIGRGIQAGNLLEIALSLTLVAAGAAFIIGKNLSLAGIVGAASIVGFIHGFAHGTEASAGVPALAYFTGIAAGTTILLTIGALLQIASAKISLIPRVAGCALLVLGSASLIQAF